MATPGPDTERLTFEAAATGCLADLLGGAEARPHFEMAHRIELPVGAASAFAVADTVCLGDFAVVRLLFHLRGLQRPGTTRDTMDALGFPTLRDEPGRILSFLGAGRLWSRRRIFDPLAAGELQRADELPVPGRSIAIWAAYEFETQGPGGTRLTQTTRVRCSDRTAWLLFGGYWIATRPFLDLIRMILLRAIRRRCAVLSRTEGDPEMRWEMR